MDREPKYKHSPEGKKAWSRFLHAQTYAEVLKGLINPELNKAEVCVNKVAAGVYITFGAGMNVYGYFIQSGEAQTVGQSLALIGLAIAIHTRRYLLP